MVRVTLGGVLRRDAAGSFRAVKPGCKIPCDLGVMP